MSFAIPSILILLLLFTVNSTGQVSNCASSSCGNVRISFPFRLRSSPISCGYDHPSFELQCLNNQTISMLDSRRYIVRDINYDTYSMWVADPAINRANLSSCPLYSDDAGSWPSIFRGFSDLNRPVSFIYCVAPVNSSNYVEAPFCGNRSSIFSNSSQIYSYVVEGDRVTLLDVEESCTVDRVAWSSTRSSTSIRSLASIYGDLSGGVELSWYRALCGDCESSINGVCILEGSRVICRHQCRDDRTTLPQQSFKCQFEYWGYIYGAYIMVAYAGLMALRFLIGFILLMVLVLFVWRKHRSTV